MLFPKGFETDCADTQASYMEHIQLSYVIYEAYNNDF